jgi:hypothetical protein
MARRLAGLAVPYITLDDAKARHAKRKPMVTEFDFEEIARDWKAGKISPECRGWLDMMILTEAGTPVYTHMIHSLEDANRPEFTTFRRFVDEVWNTEEEEHGACAMKVGEAIGFEFDRADVLHHDIWQKNYLGTCPPCARVLGTATYTVVQEEITYWSHRAYAECSGSKELSRMGQVIAAEERYHSYFYASRLRDVLKVLHSDGMPDAEAYRIVAQVVQNFVMPTKFHTIAYNKHVTPEKGDIGLNYFKSKRGAIRRQLGPLFLAAGGWDLVKAIIDAGTPIGQFTEAEAKAQLAGQG